MAKGYRIKMTLKLDEGTSVYKSDIYADGDYLLEMFEDRVDRKMTIAEQKDFLRYLFAECVRDLSGGINERVRYALEGYLETNHDLKKKPSRGRKK